MPGAKPIYQARGESYEIDRCEPQRRAIHRGKLDLHALNKGHYLGTRIPKKVLPGLNSIGFWNARGQQDWGLDPHRNEGVEIMFLETGSMPLLVDHRHYQMRAGNFSITRPWQLHQIGAPNIGPGRLHWLILDVGVRRPHQSWEWPSWLIVTRQDLAELTRRLRHNEHPVWAATPEIAGSFREIAGTISRWGKPHSVSELAANINLLLVRILKALGAHPPSEDKRCASHQRTVEIFLRDLESGRLDPGDEWSLDRMAEYCGMGKSTLSKYCLQQANVGPVEFLNLCRLDKAARELLSDREIPVTAIALSNGFNSSQYFATAFSKRFKCSPTEYRRSR